jgi:hypothetical protein
MRSEKDVMITLPVRINHPTDTFLLPLLRFTDENRNGEIWQATARGGSGYYSWGIADVRISQVSGGGLIRAKELGTT